MLMFRPVSQVESDDRQRSLVEFARVAAPNAKFAVYDCILYFHCRDNIYSDQIQIYPSS